MSFFEHLQRETTPEGEDTSLFLANEVSFFVSAKAVLKSHLGGRWLPFKLLFLSALVFWPVFAYRKSIEFDRPLFVSEWLKLTLEVVLLFLILEIVRHRSISFALRQSTHRILLTSYVVPVRTIITALRAFRQCVDQGDLKNGALILRAAWQAWKALEFALSDESIKSLPYEYMRSQLVRCRLELKPAGCGSILMSLLAMRQPMEFNAGEFEDLLSRYEGFLTALDGIGEDNGSLEKTA
jgi:hypothetical protein